MGSGTAAFFDIGETLGAVFEEPGASVPRLQTFAYVLPILERLQRSGTLLGIISNTGAAAAADIDRMLERANLLGYFAPELCMYSSVVGLKKDSPLIFELALARAMRALRRSRGTVVFVGESRIERKFAIGVGMEAAAHPLLAEAVAAGGRSVYLLLRTGRDDVPRLADLFSAAGVVPLRRTDVGTETQIIALATDRAIALLHAGGVAVEPLSGSAEAGDDLYLVRGLSPASSPAGFAAFVEYGMKPALDTDDGTIIALTPSQIIDDFHAGEGHGHNLKLLGDPALLFSPVAAPTFASQMAAAASFADATLAPEEVATLCTTITEARFEQVLRFVSGMDGRPGAVGRNRHVLSPQMRAVTDGLIAEFQRIGQGAFTVLRHRFEITNRDLKDVSANSAPKRTELHNVIAELPGETDEVVLVTAHLDSTSFETYKPAYDPKVHEAPGVDDDASGVAAVLLIAEFMRTIFAGRKPARTLRFALFNAEEQGMIGSARYARAEAAAGTKIAAVFQMDMIAYNSSAPNDFEIHAGTSDLSATPKYPDVERASRALADFIGRVGATLATQRLSILAPAQVHFSPDGAAGRSDHGSFHDRGYAAVAISENFFPTKGNPADSNPNYHMVTDRVFDLPFATSIARVICASTLRTAQPVAGPAFAGQGAFAMAPAASLVEVSGRLVAADNASTSGGSTVALRAAGTPVSTTVAETVATVDGVFALNAPAGSYHVVVRSADGMPLATTHETPFTVEPGRAVSLVLDVKRPKVMEGGAFADRRAALLPDMTLSAATVANITRETILDMARARVAPRPSPTALAEPAFAASSVDDDDDDPRRTLCSTERLRKIMRLAELQGYADPAIVKLQVMSILAMGESGFASRTYTTPNFVISYQTSGPAAVQNDTAEFDVMDPGVTPPTVLEKLPASNVPAYVRLVAFWLERSLRFYTSAPFSMRNPAANGPLSVVINSDDFGGATPEAFFINNRLPPELVCAVAVHELFHMVQFSYEGGGGPWADGMIEGGATFAEDTVADRMNRYLDEAGSNFNGIGLLANPNQSLDSSPARYKTSLFWRYLAEQRSNLVDEPIIGVDAYRRVIEECEASGYTTAAVSRAIRSLPFDAELCTFGYAAGMGDVPSSSETTFGNFALACYVKDVPTPPDTRFDFRENKENIHIDDVLRLVLPDAPSTDTLVQVKRERGRLTRAGAKLVFQAQVARMASRFFEVAVDADVETIDVNVTAGATFSGLIQVVAIEDSGRVRDIMRSDKRSYRRRIANALNGQRVSTVAVIVSGGNGGGSIQVSLQAAAAVADIMVTRWNSESGKEYHLHPRNAAWSWVSPDLWFEPAGGGTFTVKVRLHNKGNRRADDVSCALSYRPGLEPSADAPWLPFQDAGGAVQGVAGASIDAGASQEFSLPWKPTQAAADGIFTLRAEAACPDDANPDNNTAFSRLGISPASPGLFAEAARTPVLPAFVASNALAGVASRIAPGQKMMQSALSASSGARVRIVARSARPDDPARPCLPGALAASSALTIRLRRPDGSLAPGATMFLVPEGGPAPMALAGVAGLAAPAVRSPSMFAGAPVPERPAAGLYARLFWGVPRHEAIAAAAEQHFSQKALEEIERITAPLGDNVRFSQLAGWADQIKRRAPKPGDDADTAAFLTDPRNRAQDTWHYVNIPCHADSYDRVKYPKFTRDDDVVQMTGHAVRVLAGESDRFSRLNALRLVTHLVGDVHQPIHVGCGYIDTSGNRPTLVLDPQVAAQRNLDHDRGGGRLLLPGAGNLHGYWDSRLGSVPSDGGEDNDRDHGFAVAELKPQLIQKLLDMTRALPLAHADLFASPDPARWAEQWANASLEAARAAYQSLRISAKSGTNFSVSWEGKTEYDERCTPIANERLASAVRNLADLINVLLG